MADIEISASNVKLIGGRQFFVYRDDVPVHADAAAAFNAAFERLDGEHVSGKGPVGVVVVVDVDTVRANPLAVWPDTQLFHAGWRPDGRSLRVRYFKDALVTTPLPGRIDPLPPREEWRRVFPLPDEYRVHRFGAEDGPGVEDVLALWAREEAVPELVARQRVDEVMLVATHGDDLVAVMTGYLQRNDQLAVDAWYERAFVAAEHRRSNVAMHLAIEGIELLEEQWVSSEERRGVGAVIEVEHPGLRGGFPMAVWPYTLTHFIGDSARGATVYVRYFPGAVLPV